MYGHLVRYRKVRHLTVEELEHLRTKWPWVTDPIGSLPLDVRTLNCLRNGEIAFLGELVQCNERELLRLKNFGRKCLKLVKSVLVACLPVEGLPASGPGDLEGPEADQEAH
ncbi:MAG: hypothetical protein FJ109_13820 [Deltaproteobacteria bacterium]|nr:hypothetical protein [Deltaproteobacteria bacterium]